MIFISYCSLGEGKNEARKLMRELERAHFPCFLAPDKVGANKIWTTTILGKIKECSCFVGMINEGFIQSPTCQQEVGAALAWEKPMLLITDTEPPGFVRFHQACERQSVLKELKTDEFRCARVAAYIHGARTENDFKTMNSIHNAFKDEWDTMSTEDKLAWLAAGASNSGVRAEGYNVGLDFKRRCVELKSKITKEWLFLHDSDQTISDAIKPTNPKRQVGPKKLSRRDQMLKYL